MEPKNLNVSSVQQNIALELKEQWNKIAKSSKVGLATVVNFLLSSLDNLIKFVEPSGLPGADKKAVVMSIINNVYDYIIPNVLPIWLRPFNKQIKNLIVNIIISQSIDFIVAKYKEGSWNGNEIQKK